MYANKLFLEELKGLVENRLPLNEYVVEQFQERFNQQPNLITQLYHLLVENYHILSFIDDLEAIVYDYIVSTESAKGKTFYGATMFVAETFQLPQVYIKYKITQYRQPYLQQTA